jgi:hypothetical protein
VHLQPLRPDLHAGVEDGSGGEVDLLHVVREREHAVTPGRIDPALDEHDAGRALLRDLLRLLRRVREDREDRLVGVVELDAEVGRLVEPDGDHAVLERALQAAARREDLVARDVARAAHVDAHGRAVERELAEAAIHVAAVRPPLEARLLAVVVDDERTLHALLLDRDRVFGVALDRGRILRVDDEVRRHLVLLLALRRAAGEERRGDREGEGKRQYLFFHGGQYTTKPPNPQGRSYFSSASARRRNVSA